MDVTRGQSKALQYTESSPDNFFAAGASRLREVFMSARLRASLVGVGAIALVVFQFYVKPIPGPEAIQAQEQMFSDTLQWKGRLAPDFEVPLLDGTTFRLTDHIGRRVIVLNFFATWCGPCRAEMPELEAYQQAHESEGSLLIGIDAEEKHTVVDAFAKELKVTFPIGIDGTGDVGRLYGVSGFPTTIVIGADGRVTLYQVGGIANADVALRGAMAAEFAAIREKRGVSVESYRAALKREGQGSAAAVTPPLSGRALRIAQAMPCPCGCDDTVQSCNCKTSKGIRERLAKGGFDSQSDAEVMQALNREFCMKGMQ